MRKKLIILVFLMIITLPQISFWIVNGDTKEVSTTENRKLNEKPELKISTITEYPQKFDDYYNDHLPFRTELRTLWTKLNYRLFNTTVDSRVIIGKEGWLFYRGDNSIEQVQGTINFTDNQKERILTGIQTNAQKLKEKNIEMYVLILPNKENIYREYLPDSIIIKDQVSRTEKLVDYIQKETNINIVYPKEELLEAKKDYQIYKKYDTHWNDIGAFIGTIALQKKIDSSFSFDLNNMTIEEKDKLVSGDLANFASLNDELFEKAATVVDFYPEIQCTSKSNGPYTEFNSNSKNDKTVLFIGDSFREGMQQYLSKLYKRVIYMHRDDYKNEVEKFNPDIVIVEAVERFSNGISKKLLD